MIIKRIIHPINTRSRISSDYYDRNMLWLSNDYISERNRNGGYLLFMHDEEHDQISALSGAGEHIEDLEFELTNFIYGPSIVNIAYFYDEQTDRLKNEDDIL